MAQVARLLLFACCLCVQMMVARAAIAAPQADAGGFRVPALVFAGEPRGPYATGTFEALWVNQALNDPSTADPDDKRKLMVQVWYPAEESSGRSRTAPYAISPELYGADHWALKLSHVQTSSVLDAPLARRSGRFPVLVYNPGAGSPHFSATFQTEFLASHGYVVVAIGHSGANDIQRFTDGTSYRNDGQQSGIYDAPAGVSLREQLEYMWAHSDLDLYVDDISFVLDRLTGLDKDRRSRFHGRLDMDRVGAMGWSLGGFVSLQATVKEPRIRAVVNLDGWPYGLLGQGGAVTRGLQQPVMLMFNGATHDGPNATREGGGHVDAAEVEAGKAAALHYWTLLRRSTFDWYHVSLARTHHGHFSDHVLFDAHDPEMMNPRAAHEIINNYVLAFFDRYVAEPARESPLLSDGQHYRDVIVLQKKEAP